ncbi:MAG: polyphosphate kinase 1 [Pseudomonadales bacterium]|jgi:polyphosphate kinase|nr:polyphosphate kinase 1 [Pseudomonadales bacterium]
MSPVHERIEKEISWLSFNERVLQEAIDKKVPLIERLRFLGIFSNNMDEFFRVRVADVNRRIIIARAKIDADLTVKHEKKLLRDIQEKVQQLQARFDQTYNEILAELAQRNVLLLNETQLTEEQGDWIQEYFRDELKPALSTWLLDRAEELPQIEEKLIYLAVDLVLENGTQLYSLIAIPTEKLGRFIPIPKRYSKGKRTFILLDDIIRYCLLDVYSEVMNVAKADAYTVKLTRDAELERGEEITQSLLDQLSSSLKKRLVAAPVRFVYDREMPEQMLKFFVRKLGMNSDESHMPGGRYHNFKDFVGFPAVGRGKMVYEPLQPLTSPQFEKYRNLFKAIREQDILLYYPYHSFKYFTELLRQASIDPRVTAISISIYRVANDSRVVSALIAASQNNKHVSVNVELQARFDEEANIEWSKRLTDAGVMVEFGVPNLKVHTKICLIKRIEKGKEVKYAHIGTGNFHEKTAEIYTDFSLFTCHPGITEEADRVFDFISHSYRRHNFRHLWVSPLNNRDNFRNRIKREIANAGEGKSAEIILKANNLVDHEIIDLLYDASQAGVIVRLIIRGMCCLTPGIKGLSENITAISIVDRYLEHPRVSVFHNNGDPEVYISSADIMQRNLDFRVEVGCPIYDTALKNKIIDILEIQFSDRAKARVINAQQNNPYVNRGNRKKIRSQMEIRNYLARNG